MPKLDGTGPKGEGSRSGRKLGKCSNADDNSKLQRLGKGLGNKGNSGGGKGNRFKSGLK